MKRELKIIIAISVLLIAVSIFCIVQALRANADVTPIIMPTKPTVPTMNIGASIKPTPDDDGYLHTPTTLATASFAPPVTAKRFGGELG